MTRNNKIKLASIASIASICLFAVLTVGCENADPDPNFSWNGNGVATPAPATGDSGSPATEDSTGGASDVSSGADQAPFGSFKWIYGGFNGASAVHSGVNISGLKISKGGFSFHYDTNLSAWGLSHGDASALACFFVQKGDGSWVGGKFDWISSSRTYRDLNHLHIGYGGWTLAGVPNPCQAAFVIVSKDGKKRSNVLVGTWTR